MALGEQFNEMVRRLGSEGGFSYNPRAGRFDTEGYAVATYPDREHTDTPATSETLGAYHARNSDLLQTAPHYMGGWRDPEGHDVLDVSKVYPQTPGGHSAARYQAVKHGQQALFNMGASEEEMNPFRPGGEYPEFANYAAKRSMNQTLKNNPEISAWVRGPSRRGV